MTSQLRLVRIDDRLIHGQVAIGWVKTIKIQHLVVADDAVAKDSMQICLMEMATPPGLGITICPVAEAGSVCNREEVDGKRILMLFSSSGDVCRAVENGLFLKELNIGGMRYSPGKKQITKAVAIDEHDAEHFRKLLGYKVKIQIQMLPMDEPVDIQKYI
ncbi:PTS sugar transporter subunit IIB [bacterium]|nr:PTS sugar transporter subunit IIB [bacterium]